MGGCWLAVFAFFSNRNSFVVPTSEFSNRNSYWFMFTEESSCFWVRIYESHCFRMGGFLIVWTFVVLTQYVRSFLWYLKRKKKEEEERTSTKYLDWKVMFPIIDYIIHMLLLSYFNLFVSILYYYYPTIIEKFIYLFCFKSCVNCVYVQFFFFVDSMCKSKRMMYYLPGRLFEQDKILLDFDLENIYWSKQQHTRI